MGQSTSTLPKTKLEELVKKEFNSALKKFTKDRDYLVLHELFKLTLPEDMQINFHHLGNLFNIDKDRDGRFSLEDFTQFMLMASERIKKYKPHEIQSQLQAYCTLHMYLGVKTKDQEDDFIGWIGHLLYAESEFAYFDDAPDIPFVRSEIIGVFYEIFNVRVTHNLDFQQFFDLLQQAGEEEGLMNLESEDQDNFVPLQIVQQFSRDFIRGFSKLMEEVGFGH